MSELKFLKKQIIETRLFTNQLLDEVPSNKWFEVSQNTNSNIAWQVCHILMAQNYHAISCVHGQDKEVFDTVPVFKLAKLAAGLGSNERKLDPNTISKEQIVNYSNLVYKRVLILIDTLSEPELNDALEPTPFKNPIAVTKYESLSWSFKHEMWHCSEIEQIKRELNHKHQWIR